MRLGALTSLLALTAAASPALAQERDAPAALQLIWSAPPECPQREAVVAQVERILGHPLATGGEALVVAGVVARQRPWRVQLAIGTNAGGTSRALTADTCEHLADATALILALAIEPDGDLPDDATAPPAALATPTSDTPQPAAPAAGSATAPGSATPPGSNAIAPVARRIPLRAAAGEPALLDEELFPSRPRPRPVVEAPIDARGFTLGAGVIADGGLLPGAGGAGVEARIGYRVPSLRFTLRGDFWPQRLQYFTRRSGGFDYPDNTGIDLLSVGAQACLVPWPARFELRVCAALDVGSMRAHSTVPNAAGQSGLWAAAYLEAGLGIRIARWLSVHLDVGPGLTLASPRFVYVDVQSSRTEPVFQPNAFFGRAALTLDVGF